MRRARLLAAVCSVGVAAAGYADRTWFVATEVDGYSTYVGGSTTCIAAILARPGLEALRVTVRSDAGRRGH